ncbi:tetratricopeptide repeat protein [Mangrovibacterium diazotrophicum]|uniref:hypothetical protein n=1 Tax=Mangrovibacterium diazotrophicum TaxID=1261403 RepID=UPI0011C38330|nr:hypothetical protein [Mangrovibacterium diazotrophicum]
MTIPVACQNADSLLLIKAKIELKNGNFSKSRDYAEKVIQTNLTNSDAYIVLGQAYISSIDSCFKYEFDKGMVYCLAVQTFEKAASLTTDSVKKSNALNLAKLYSNYFFDPSVYHHIDWPKEGEEFLIENWINKKTIVHYYKIK